jgi:malonyl-ACP decarboxylase
VAHSGFVWGEGSAALLLESTASVSGRADHVLAELQGASVVLDGTHLPEPCLAGESSAMQDALDAAGVDPRQIDYLNAHGSGSPLGDRTECAAIERVFGPESRVWINATKALTGHCISSSAILEAVACVLQLRSGFLHPNINLASPIHRRLRFAGRHAERLQAQCALSNAFGFGGINSSVVIRVTPPREPEGNQRN